MTEELEGQMSLYAQSGLFGRMFREQNQVEIPSVRISESSSKKSQESRIPMPQFLCLQKENGVMPDASWQIGGALLGEYSMDSFGEAPTTLLKECRLDLELRNAVGESRLSQILMDRVHPRFYLSGDACKGIVSRIKKRGKEGKVPPLLLKVLMAQANGEIINGKCLAPAYCVDQGGGKSVASVLTEVSPTLTTTHDGDPAVLTNGISFQERSGKEGGGKGILIQEGHTGALSTLNNQYVLGTIGHDERSTGYDSEVLDPLTSVDYKQPPIVATKYAVRRITPEEAEILQGYPVGWTDIGEWTDSTGKKRKTSLTARYKALGNSICLPPWKWILKRISATYDRDATMGSLFDGIGGFPYLWEQLNGKGTCLWASEIDEFPIAVTERRINGKGESNEI